MQDEWIDLPDGTRLHRETVEVRTQTLGWTNEQATSTPVGQYAHKDGSENIASKARADGVQPSRVQQLMRDFNATYDQAVAYINAN